MLYVVTRDDIESNLRKVPAPPNNIDSLEDPLESPGGPLFGTIADASHISFLITKKEKSHQFTAQ